LRQTVDLHQPAAYLVLDNQLRSRYIEIAAWTKHRPFAAQPGAGEHSSNGANEMKRLTIIRGGVTMALMLGILAAVAASADASPSGQLGAYMRQGLSLKQAQVALATQSQVETAELPAKLEEALGASFAGAWFEPSRGKFSIGVVSGASRRVAERVVAQAGLAGVVSYVSVRSTWSQLISAQGEWGIKLAHLGGGQFSTGLIASHNAVSVTLSSSVPEHQRALLEREAAGSHVNVSITVVPPKALEIRPANSQCAFKSKEAYCNKPIAAGVLITLLNSATPTHWCTAGPLAILANPATLVAELETLLITAGHCTEGTEKWFTSTHAPRVTEEIGSVVQSLWDLHGDHSDIAVGSNWLEPGVTPALAQITNYQDSGLHEALNVIGEAASTPNASFCKQGATSGEQCGTITEETSILLLYGGHDVDGLVKTTACAEGGDSGGPNETLPTGNSVRILGTLLAIPEGQKCAVLTCTGCTSWYEPIKTSLAALGLFLLTTSNQTRHSSARHPLFLTESGSELLFSGEGSNPVLRAVSAGVLGTIACEKVLVDGWALSKSSLAHRVKTIFEGKCEQNVNGTKTVCTEPIEPNLALAELGLVLGNKTVGVLLEPSGTKEFVKVTCGPNVTTVEGAVIGEIPEIVGGVNQYNKLLSETTQVFEAENKNSAKQNITKIELLGVPERLMPGKLTVTGFFGGEASEEATAKLKGDGKIEICTQEPQKCP
jgi:hypothetical protein